MNQKQLEIFTVLAQTLNFTKTAEQLYLSQTTVTLQIRSLEEELNIKLFERTSRSVKLTYAGSVFLEGAKTVLESMRTARQEAAFAAQGYVGQLKIGFADDVNASGVSGVLRKFSQEQPHIRLTVQGGFPGNLLAGLIADEFDLVFTPSFRRIRNEKLTSKVMGTYRTMAAFHRDHPFAGKKAVKFSDFEGEDFIVISGDRHELDFSTDFVRQLDARHIHINRTAKTDNIETVFLLLDSGLGVTVLPEYFTGRFSGTSQIRTCPIDEKMKPTEFVAVWKDRAISEELADFLRIADMTCR